MSNIHKRRDDIQVLRAVAVIGVIGYHYFPSIVRNGYLGVDLFFLISGFVITGLIVRAKSEGRLSYSSFIYGRVRRLFPALIFVTAVSTLVALLLLDADQLRQYAISAIFALTYTSNFYFSLTSSDYWAPEASFSPLLHTWSLGVEQFFYIFYPLLFIFIISIKRRLFYLACIGLISLSSYILLTENESLKDFGFYWPTSRIWEIILGCFAYFLRNKFSKSRDFSLSASSFILSIASISLVYCFNLPSVLTLTLTCVLTFLLLIIPARISLVINFLKKIGDMSYSLYLWHWPLISFATILFGRKPPFSITLVLILMTLIFGYATFTFIEKKYNALKTPPTVIFAPLTALLLLLMVTATTSDWPQNIDIKIIKSIKSTERAPMSDVICRSETEKYLNSDYCKFENDNFKRTLVVTGDSHADIAFEGLQTLSNKFNSNILLIANSNCPTLVGVTVGSGESSRICTKNSLDAINFIVMNPEIDRVLIVIRGSYYLTGQDYNDAPVDSSSLLTPADSKKRVSRLLQLQESLFKTVQMYHQAGKSVYILTENPEMNFRPLFCMTKFVKLFATCSPPSTDSVQERMRRYRDVIASIPNVKIINITDIFCDQYCNYEIDGNLLYADNDHLSQFGAGIQAKYILNQLNEY